MKMLLAIVVLAFPGILDVIPYQFLCLSSNTVQYAIENTMAWILSKIISYEVLAEEVLFLRKSKAGFVLTNLKTFGPSSFVIIKSRIP